MEASSFVNTKLKETEAWSEDIPYAHNFFDLDEFDTRICETDCEEHFVNKPDVYFNLRFEH